MTLSVVAVGAHPDDIEIAAGGALATLVLDGAIVSAIVATDETDPATAQRRRDEARTGLRALGLPDDRVQFLGLPDRDVTPDSASIASLEHALGRLGVRPDVVITHSVHDLHRDHRAVAAIVQEALGAGPLTLGMVVVNSLAESFVPEVFVDVSEVVELKLRAVAAHQSQEVLGRLRWAEIERFERANAAPFGFARVEAFEIVHEPWQVAPEIAARIWRRFIRSDVGSGRNPRLTGQVSGT